MTNTPAERIRKQETEILAAVDKDHTDVETEFKKLDVEVCGPHCLAKDNGSGHHVIVQHCLECHDEYELKMDKRPVHGASHHHQRYIPVSLRDETDQQMETLDRITTAEVVIHPINSPALNMAIDNIRRPNLFIHDHNAPLRLKDCVARWPECEEGKYDPRCCRFPKSCSCTIYDPMVIKADELETR